MSQLEIRDAGFWRDIEQLFEQPDQIELQPIKSGVGQCFCSQPQLLDRLQLACHRADRTNNCVLLLLIQLPRVKRKKIVHDANRLSTCLRASDSLCDLGTDRFALLINDIDDAAVAPMVIERLLSVLDGVAMIGATVFPVVGMTNKRVWASAEAALGKAIEIGAGTYRLAPMVTGRIAMEQIELSKDLHMAYRNNEFEAVYQSIVGLADQRIRAVEVLLRWRHPVYGCLTPDVFLPLLEESGLIVPVGEQMLADTCRFVAALHANGCENFRACINVSSRQLEDGGFLLSVLDALYDAELDPAWLQLEFQESIVTQHPRLVQRIFPELRNAGVQLALDRFGAGNAPLSELVRLPINLIKLDRSLVEHIVDDPVSQAIVSGTLALANTADMQVAAVGVEQELQNGMLERLGCCEAQGQYYFQPLIAAELRSLLAGVRY